MWQVRLGSIKNKLYCVFCFFKTIVFGVAVQMAEHKNKHTNKNQLEGFSLKEKTIKIAYSIYSLLLFPGYQIPTLFPELQRVISMPKIAFSVLRRRTGLSANSSIMSVESDSAS